MRTDKPSWKVLRLALMVAAAVLVPALAQGKGPVSAQKKPVNINTASMAELEAVKGVGAATAKKIIAGRPYKSLDEMSKAGLSARKIRALESSLTVGPASESAATKPKESKGAANAPTGAARGAAVEKPSASAESAGRAKPAKEKGPSGKLAPGQKVDINTAGKEELEKLPEIGPVKAQAIVDGRPYHKIEDVMKVKGIKQHTFDRIKEQIRVSAD